MLGRRWQINMAPRNLGGLDLETKRGRSSGLSSRAYSFAALYADGADVNGLRLAVERHFLFLKVGLEKPFGSSVGMAVRVAGNGLFAAKFAFVRHAFIIANR